MTTIKEGLHYVRLPNGEYVSAGKARSHPANAQRLSADHEQPIEGRSLVGIASRKNKSRDFPAYRFEITFRIFAVRPADWDGYHIKELQDMVVRSGMLPDDNWRVLQGRVIVGKANSKIEERTEIEIEPDLETQLSTLKASEAELRKAFAWAMQAE